MNTQRLILPAASLAFYLAIAACSAQNTPATPEDGPVADASETTGIGSNPVSNAVQDGASAAVGLAEATAAGRSTELFVPAAIISDMYEIEAGRIAVERTTNAELRQFAQRMIDHHTKASNDFRAALKQGNVAAPANLALDERRQGLIDNLRQASAQDFDTVYRNQQVAAHEEALALHRTYAENGDNQALRAAATAMVPIVEQHLADIRRLRDAAGAMAPAATGSAAAPRP
jgi:putative membrane protein